MDKKHARLRWVAGAGLMVGILACGAKDELVSKELGPETPSGKGSETAIEASRPPGTPLPVGVMDRGVFPDLDGRVVLDLPPWIPTGKARLVLDRHHGLATLYAGPLPLKVYPLESGVGAGAASPGTATPSTPASTTAPPTGSRSAAGAAGEAEQVLSVESLPLRPGDRLELIQRVGASLPVVDARKAYHPLGDADQDGIPDPVDVSIGAQKVALNGAHYRETYERLRYPLGDVARDHGVCTDVVIRAMRNAGIDLQKVIYEDMLARPKRYGAGRADKNIDHRRVRRLIAYFGATYRALPVDFQENLEGENAFLPGDIVFLDTFPSRSGPDHIGIISDVLSESGQPAVVNNWTDGFVEQEMGLLPSIPVTHRFRIGLKKR